jgi:hypothetical protein
MFSRRFIPPEECLAWSPARSASPVRVSISALRRLASAVGMPYSRAKNIRFSRPDRSG